MPPKLVVFVSFRPSTDVVDDNKSASKTKWKRKWEKEESSELKAGESDSLAGAEKCASRQVEIVSEYDFIVDFKDVEIKHFFSFRILADDRPTFRESKTQSVSKSF